MAKDTIKSLKDKIRVLEERLEIRVHEEYPEGTLIYFEARLECVVLTHGYGTDLFVRNVETGRVDGSSEFVVRKDKRDRMVGL